MPHRVACSLSQPTQETLHTGTAAMQHSQQRGDPSRSVVADGEETEEEDENGEEKAYASTVDDGDVTLLSRTLRSTTERYGCLDGTGSVDWVGLQLHLRHKTHQSQITMLDLTSYRMAKGGDLWMWFVATVLPQLRMLEVLRLVQMGLGDNEVAELVRSSLLPAADNVTGTGTRRCYSAVTAITSSPAQRAKRRFSAGQPAISSAAPVMEVSLPHLRVLDLSGNNLSQRSCTPLGKAMLWLASSLEEVRLLGNPLRDYGCQTLAVYLCRLSIEGLLRDPGMFPQQLHQEYQQLRRRFQTSSRADRFAGVVMSPNDVATSLSSGLLPKGTATTTADDDVGLQAALAALPIGLTLLDLRDCRASARGLSDVLAGASRAHRLHTVILSHNAAGVSALLPAPQSAYREAGLLPSTTLLLTWARTAAKGFLGCHHRN